MTKDELKKLETEQKHVFIARVYASMLSCIPEQTIMLRKEVQIRLTHKGYGLYIRYLQVSSYLLRTICASRCL